MILHFDVLVGVALELPCNVPGFFNWYKMIVGRVVLSDKSCVFLNLIYPSNSLAGVSLF